MWNLKKVIKMNLFTKQKQTYRLREWTYGYQQGSVEGREKLGGWNGHIHTTIYKIGKQQGPTVEHRTILNIL